jgi:pimeloyl-ACP methyl ester carboxylesterase
MGVQADGAARVARLDLGATTVVTTPPSTVDRDTAVVSLAAGPVEYRLGRAGVGTVLVFHGGHVRAGLALGEDVFTAAGYGVLAPSRPGYGRTPVRTGGSPAGFADATRELCEHLGIGQIAAVVGTSGGSHTAITMAARHPDLVTRLILQSAVSFLPWPGRTTRLGAHLVFGPATESLTWRAIHALMRRAPDRGLRLMLGPLSTGPAGTVLAGLSQTDRATLVALFSRMRSGHGFVNDLRPTPDVTAEVGQPTLVIASRQDRAVPFAHARSLASAIRHAELVTSQAGSHFIWFSGDYPQVADRIRGFLSTEPAERPQAPTPAD